MWGWAFTGEDPWGVVDEQKAEGFGVVCFKTLDDELDGLIFLERSALSFPTSMHETYHVRQGETRHVEDDGLSMSVHQQTRIISEGSHTPVSIGGTTINLVISITCTIYLSSVS